MIFILNNKKYDTSKMQKIAIVYKNYKYEISPMLLSFQKDGFSSNFLIRKECELYRSSKGNWLLVYRRNSDFCGEAISEDEAKNLLIKYDFKAYENLFGAIEEA